MFMSTYGLDKTAAFGLFMTPLRLQQVLAFEDPINCGRTNGNDILVQHHVGQTTIAFIKMLPFKLDDGSYFPSQQPMAFGNFINLVLFFLALFPLVKFTLTDRQPFQKNSQIFPCPFLPV
jgi:hypothetical protein